MKLGMLFGFMMFAFLEVVGLQFQRAYGIEKKNSLEYVALITASLLILFLGFPDWD